jgi:50S ribosomal protein L16 3-hydroxylase
MRQGLAALLHPHAVSELAASIARDQPFAVHGARDAAAALFALPLLASLEALLDSWPDHVRVHLPELADEASAITASPRDARKLFASGMGLLFDDVQRFAPALVPWLTAIRVELGLSALTEQRCLVYATPAGNGTGPHFDQNVNLVLQLHGSKTWWLAPNTHVARPLTRHTIGLAADPELSSYARLPMPDALPADRSEVVLAPGSVLYVPRGIWHATHATSDALSLNFTFSPPTWIDLFTAALRSRLALSPAWRATAAPREITAFDTLLRELAADATTWTAHDILAATEA